MCIPAKQVAPRAANIGGWNSLVRMRAENSLQLVEMHGFYQVMIESGRAGLLAVVGLTKPGEGDQAHALQLGTLPKLDGDLKAVMLRQR